MQKIETNSDFEVRSLDTMCLNESKITHKWYHQLKYLGTGILFGIILVKAEIISWFRIQEMFRLQSFHMYGVIGSAVVVGIISIFIIKKFNVKTIYGEKIEFNPKSFNKGQIYGGLLFGSRLGYYWGLSGACICSNWRWELGGGCYFVKCHCWDLYLWVF
jgi:hypothetical protein